MKLRGIFVVVLALFMLLPVAAQDDMGMGTVNVGGSDELGNFLVDAEGMTLYLFTNDGPSASNCIDGCLKNWPALTVESADDLTAGEGMVGRLGVIEREDTGELQVTYNYMPLYYFAQDEAPGDVTGQGRGDVWYVVPPQITALSGSDELGDFLVDRFGMTLYIFTNDEAGVSNCTGGCLENWPALTVSTEAELYAGLGSVPADSLGVIEREDTGALQVTYMDMPLYYFIRDEAAGDVTGQGVNDVWYVVQPEIVSVGGNEELGEFLVGSDDMTLYLFTNDEAGVSNCAGGCAANWPPLTVASEASLAQVGEGVTGELSLVEREDGSLQVAYNGMPLYYWIRDAAPGDATGQGRGEVWYVVAP